MVKERRKVLIIGLADSVHLGRWLSQFSAEEIDFYIFPSKKYRNVHKLTEILIKESECAQYVLLSPIKNRFFFGYLDFIYFELFGKLLKKFTRVFFLTHLLQHEKYDYVHAIEIQGAGYLIDSLDLEVIKNQKIIVTNWGSDIYYFSKFPEHVVRIKSLLSKAKFYSAECKRDYVLATAFGFTGEVLPCIPNAGGFNLEVIRSNALLTSKRQKILIKGYGGTFGRADIIIPLLPKILKVYPEFRVHIYSVTDDVLKIIDSLSSEVKSKIRTTTNRDRISHAEMLFEFATSRIHVGCSESDGISTAFLESIVMGSYPIQTNTSCANEWVDLGVLASVVKLNSDEILDQIFIALKDDQLVDIAAEVNFNLALKHLDYRVIQKKALDFYK